MIPSGGIQTMPTICTTENNRENKYLDALPKGFMPFEEFEREFDLRNTSTEQLHPITLNLSQVMHESLIKGMELLLEVDENVIKGLEAFFPSIENYAAFLSARIKLGGRIYLVGSGSSGRTGINIAAICKSQFPKYGHQIEGVIAGGDSAFIRAREGFEDSENDGENALKDARLGPKDVVFLISASGSASFNVGCGHFAANEGATVFYFYNSTSIPTKTQKLFERSKNPVTPLCIDIGPQAIGGSTRLQGATLAQACLGALLTSALYHAQGKKLLSTSYPKTLATQMLRGFRHIRKHLETIQLFAKKEVEVFSDPRANFRQHHDHSKQGYTTFLANIDFIREGWTDPVETSPTFSTHPIRRTNDRESKREEFRAFVVGAGNNSEAWKVLLGRDVHLKDVKDTESFLLSSEEEGIHSFSDHPVGEGNFVIGVAKATETETVPDSLIKVLNSVKEQKGSVGLILTYRGKLEEGEAEKLRKAYDCVLIMEEIPTDLIGFTESILLKQVLNLISNSSMVLMNKVHGNQMIDVRASNKKLIDRCIRLIKSIWAQYQPDCLPEDKVLYHYVAHVKALRDAYEAKGIYTPSVVKIVLAMIALNKTPENFQEVIDYLAERQESIAWIGKS